MKPNPLQIQQVDAKLLVFKTGKNVAVPPAGWIKAIRTAIGMSLQQLGNKLSITKQAVLELENREKEGSITIKTLREVARALDMQLVYSFVPNDGSIEALIDRKARELAVQIVLRTSNTMQLEDQQNTTERLEKAIQERVKIIKDEMPKILWD